MSGKPTSTNLMVLGSTPCDCSTALITRPPMLLRVFTAIFLPARSAGVLIGESGITSTPLKPGLALSPPAITVRSMPWLLARNSDTQLEKAIWMSPETSEGIRAAPPWACWNLTVRPSCLK
jgi:hypothetical protein